MMPEQMYIFPNTCSDARIQIGLNVRFNEDQQLTSDADILKWVQQIGK